jgi:hypothetical protein
LTESKVSLIRSARLKVGMMIAIFKINSEFSGFQNMSSFGFECSSRIDD